VRRWVVRREAVRRGWELPRSSQFGSGICGTAFLLARKESARQQLTNQLTEQLSVCSQLGSNSNVTTAACRADCSRRGTRVMSFGIREQLFMRVQVCRHGRDMCLRLCNAILGAHGRWGRSRFRQLVWERCRCPRARRRSHTSWRRPVNTMLSCALLA